MPVKLCHLIADMLFAEFCRSYIFCNPTSRLAMDEDINDNDALVARVQQLENGM